jgi:histidyl-tRNA synthetase
MEELGGPPTPGVGWAAGIERILLAGAQQTLPAASPPVELLVASPNGAIGPQEFKLVHEARRAGIEAQLDLGGRSMKGLLKHADRLHARFVAWVEGEGFQLRDMESREQVEIAADQVVRTVLRPVL